MIELEEKLKNLKIHLDNYQHYNDRNLDFISIVKNFITETEKEIRKEKLKKIL